MLKINGLEFAYPSAPASGMRFDLTVDSGEVLSLIGPSGSGKSTLLSLIAGFLPASAGSIVVDDEPVVHGSYALGATRRPPSSLRSGPSPFGCCL